MADLGDVLERHELEEGGIELRLPEGVRLVLELAEGTSLPEPARLELRNYLRRKIGVDVRLVRLAGLRLVIELEEG